MDCEGAGLGLWGVFIDLEGRPLGLWGVFTDREGRPLRVWGVFTEREGAARALGVFSRTLRGRPLSGVFSRTAKGGLSGSGVRRGFTDLGGRPLAVLFRGLQPRLPREKSADFTWPCPIPPPAGV